MKFISYSIGKRKYNTETEAIKDIEEGRAKGSIKVVYKNIDQYTDGVKSNSKVTPKVKKAYSNSYKGYKA